MWINDEDVVEAIVTIPQLAVRIAACKQYRTSAGRDAQKGGERSIIVSFNESFELRKL